ncbi:MAG: acyl-CoA thioesterase [Flavobacteriales bacterium]|nr:acyl-CoA thioesterase [Flavobacteriales bacterium]
MIQTETKIRVRYGETDRMGYVYYGNYALYFEVARVELMRELGLTYKQIEDSGIQLPVSHYSIQYARPAYYDDEITVVCTIPEVPSGRIRFEYKCLNEAGDVLNTAETTLVFVDKRNGRPTRPPAELLDIFKKHF